MAFEYKDLKDFQKQALSELESAYHNEFTKEIVFHSCTGSGKTIVLSFLIKQLSEENEKLIFIWLTPGTGDLEIQSQSKFDHYLRNSDSKLLKDVMVTGFEENDVCFINWELVNKAGNLALTESENKNLIEHINTAHNEGYKFILIIDEEHVNKTAKSNNIIELFNPSKIIRASATPKNIGNATVVKVNEEAVIRDGLIKKILFINEGISDSESIDNQTTFLVEKAINKQRLLRKKFIDNNIDVNPLIIIQVPNESDNLITQVESYLESKDITYENKRLAIRLANKKENLDDIERNESEPIAIIIKQAVAVGWDCPRAYILVKLRENMDESFEIQTIGRIRRMPQAVHYNIRELDSAYLYTFDQKFTEGVQSSLGKAALKSDVLKLKEEYKKFSIPHEKKSSFNETSNISQARSILKKYLEHKYKLKNVSENKSRMTKYTFDENILIRAKQGNVSVIENTKLNKLNTIESSEKLNPSRHRNEYHRSIKKIASSIGMSYDEMSKIIRSLFAKDSKFRGKILSLDTHNLYAFVINNTEELKNDFLEANSDITLQEELEIANIDESEFVLPEEFIFTYDPKINTYEQYNKNVYYNYTSNAAPRSDGEKHFERFCENSNIITAFFKNGDNGAGYFSLLYVDNMLKYRLFYPDYIVWSNNQIFIFEVKGAQNTSGQSENIDIYTAHKDSALKKFLRKHKLKGGIVRLNKSDLHLYVCEGPYVEDMNNPSWKELSKYIRG